MTESSTNLQNTVNNVLQEVLNIRTKKTNILLWNNSSLPNSFILKDREGKRYLGLLRKDRKGENYWKFKEIERKNSQNNPESNPVMDKVKQFNQRQEKAREYANHANASKE